MFASPFVWQGLGEDGVGLAGYSGTELCEAEQPLCLRRQLPPATHDAKCSDHGARAWQACRQSARRVSTARATNIEPSAMAFALATRADHFRELMRVISRGDRHGR